MASGNEDNKTICRIETLISTIAEKRGFNNFKLKTTSISTDGANFMGDLFHVDVIEEGKEILNLFVKTANTPEHVRKVIPANKVYKHEVFVYTTVADNFHDLQERHGVPEEKRFKFPKYYGSNLKDMEEMLVLENLTTQQFVLYDRFKPIDWQYAKAAVEEIAKFHALSFALKKENPSVFENITKSIPNFYLEYIAKAILDYGVKLLPVAVDVTELENQSRLQKYINENIDIFLVKQFEPVSKYCTLIHSDYRSSNILIKYQDKQISSLKPVDYQGLLYGNPLNDIIYFLFNGSDEEFRRQHFDEYFEHYHNSLAQHLKLLSHDINEVYPKSAFYLELKDKLFFGLEVALLILNIVLVDPKKAVPIETLTNPDMGDVIADSLKPSELYVERLNGIIRDFERWGYFNNCVKVLNESSD